MNHSFFVAVKSIKKQIQDIAKKYHLTTIIVTHDPEEALTLSDRVMILNEGGISQFAKPEELVLHPANEFIQKFILNQLEIKRHKDMISVTDVASSSTAWLLIQALVSEYGEDGAKDILTDIYKNAGEVAIGLGLRQQVVADKEETARSRRLCRSTAE